MSNNLFNIDNIDAFVASEKKKGSYLMLEVQPAANGGWVALLRPIHSHLPVLYQTGHKMKWAVSNLNEKCEKMLAEFN